MRFIRWTALAACLVIAGPAVARDPIVGGAPMSPGRTIVDNASRARDLSTLVELLKLAGLTETLQGAGPFTVFAPSNAAFRKLPEGAIDNLRKPEDRPQLRTVMSYHVVQGTLTTRDLAEQIKSGGGKAEIKTVQGEELTVEKEGRVFKVTDAKGNVANVTIADVMQANGVVHVIDGVLLP